MYQLELKDVGAILSFGTSLNGGVLVAQKRIVVVVEVCHGEELMKSREWILILKRSRDPICGLEYGDLADSRSSVLLPGIYSEAFQAWNVYFGVTEIIVHKNKINAKHIPSFFIEIRKFNILVVILVFILFLI